jgi:hypothetical protein
MGQKPLDPAPDMLMPAVILKDQMVWAFTFLTGISQVIGTSFLRGGLS